MSCNKFKILLSVYIDGELKEEDKKNLLEHISFCDNCKKELEKLNRIQRIFSFVEKKMPDEFFETRLFAHIRDKETKKEQQIIIPLLKRVVPAVLILVFLLLGVLNIEKIFYKKSASIVSDILIDQQTEENFDKTLLEIYYGKLNSENTV